MQNSDARFTGGMVIYASVAPASTSSRTIRVPIAAVRRAYGQSPYVLVVETKGDRQIATAREVRLGATDGLRIEVLRGLGAGESLIVRGQHLVVPGDMVRTKSAKSDQ
jgi:hypothetical protein